ncbi:MAG: restriction endonuclease [Christensenellaceae bacterium]|nr:restriction endonuclease [Christensenellaceae bacterium]
MQHILKYMNDEHEHSIKDCVDHLEEKLELTAEDMQRRVPSGRDLEIYNRVAWALFYLKKAMLLKSCHRGYSAIAEEGRKVLSENPEVPLKLLKDYIRNSNSAQSEEQSSDALLQESTEEDDKTPEETIGALSLHLDSRLAGELLESIKNIKPYSFEILVVDLLLKMGYGLEGSGKVTNESGDEGIDGIIKQDELGLDMIYIQAKKWDTETSIHRPEIMKFVGAMAGKKASKGVFITTARFSKGAVDYANDLAKRIILIDGQALARLMIKHDLGVETSNIIRIKKINSDYFNEK